MQQNQITAKQEPRQLPLFGSLGDQRQQMYDNFKQELLTEGHSTCPCCQRKANIRKTRISSDLAIMLCRLYRLSMAENLHGTGYQHVLDFAPDVHTVGRNFCIVKHWGLAETMAAGDNQDKKSSGKWRLTRKGVDFVLKKITVPKYLFIYDDAVQDTSAEEFGIMDALQEKFSYKELMEWQPRK